jgi:hypothetical protein
VDITQCRDADGCCPEGCSALDDDDCSAACGNGVVEPGERCDGDCPMACYATSTCMTPTQTGSAATCDVHCTEAPTTSCTSFDGCCPSGCYYAIDRDCTPTDCGNGECELGESCPTCMQDCGFCASIPEGCYGEVTVLNCRGDCTC